MRDLKPMFEELAISPKVQAFVFGFLNMFNWATFDIIVTRAIGVLTIIAIIYSIRLARKRAKEIDRGNDGLGK